MVLRKGVEVWFAIIVVEVKWGSFAEALVVLVDDGKLVWVGAVVADGNGFFGEVAGRFVAF